MDANYFFVCNANMPCNLFQAVFYPQLWRLIKIQLETFPPLCQLQLTMGVLSLFNVKKIASDQDSQLVLLNKLFS